MSLARSEDTGRPVTPRRGVTRAGMLGLAVLVGCLGWQVWSLSNSVAGLWKRKVMPDRGLSAIERSADMISGGDFYQYVAFLRTVIPENAAVLLPPAAGRFFLNSPGLMQYFLFPRAVAACRAVDDPDCLGRIRDPSIYVLQQGDFPSPSEVPQTKLLRSFQEGLGIYVPPP